MAHINQLNHDPFFQSLNYHSASTNQATISNVQDNFLPPSSKPDPSYNIKSKTTTTKFRLLSYNAPDMQPPHNSPRRTSNACILHMQPSLLKNDLISIQQHIIRKCELLYGTSRFCISNSMLYLPVASSLRDRIMRNLSDSPMTPLGKEVFIISSSFSYGKFLKLNLVNTNLENSYRIALQDLGFSLQEILLTEEGQSYNGSDTYAANMLSCMTTLCVRAKGYGIRSQSAIYHHEKLEFSAYQNYSGMASPWEIMRSDIHYRIQLFGKTRKEIMDKKKRHIWYDTINVNAVAYDLPITGYLITYKNFLRLWKSMPVEYGNNEYYETSNIYFFAHMISNAYVPESDASKEFKFIQNYFLASASIQDIIKDCIIHQSKDSTSSALSNIAVHAFDVGPAIVAVEFVRILIDFYSFPFKEALAFIKSILSITIDKISLSQIPRWDVQMIAKILPRHYEIILKINKACKASEHANLKKLNIVNSTVVNSLDLMAACFKSITTTSPDTIKHFINTSIKPIHESNYTKMINITVSASYRVWTIITNSQLINVITDFLGNELIVQDSEQLEMLHCHSETEELQQKWQKAKNKGKKIIKEWVSKKFGISIPLDAIYDVCQSPYEEPYKIILYVLQIYKRYKEIKSGARQFKKVYFIGKANGNNDVPYNSALTSIIHTISSVINNDASLEDYLKVICIPNFTQASLQLLAPGIDIAQYLSLSAYDLTAIGMVMNGAHLILSRIGIYKEISKRMPQTVSLFGADEYEFQQGKSSNIGCDSGLKALIDEIGYICNGSECIKAMLGQLSCGIDWCWVRADFNGYMEAVRGMDHGYAESSKWTVSSIRSFSGVGYFSCDRSIVEYLKYVW